MTEGKYTAKIVNYGLSETKAGDPQAFVEFQLTDDGSKWTWFGGTKSEKQAEISAKTLVDMEFSGNNFSDLMKPNMLNTTLVYTLVIVEETYNGKKSFKVKFVNRPHQGPKSIADTNAAKKADMFSGMLAKAKAQAGIKPKVKNHAPGADDVGF